MESNFVYMTTEQIEDRKAKIAAIEGLAEIDAAIKESIDYHQAKMEYERGDRDFDDIPKYNPNLVSDLRKQYPRAAAYMEAELWIRNGDPIKVRLGSRAMEKILDGADHTDVLDEMRQGLDAFNLAQMER